MKHLKKLQILLLIPFFYFVFSSTALAQEIQPSGFVVKNIRVQGLQRITRATVINYLPVRVGQRVTPDSSDKIIEALYKTGFFSSVDVTRSNATLVIKVTEQATIARINIKGNKEIKTKQLKKALAKSKVAEGLVLDSYMLKALEQAIAQQYLESGFQNVTVHASTSPASNNRVNINIQIDEGGTIKVASIKFVGNDHFSRRALLKNFVLTTPGIFTILDHRDRYSRARLDTDLENLNKFYMDKGFLKFKVEKTDVEIRPGTKKAYITIYLNEGPRYTVSGYTISGQLLGQEAELHKMLSKEIKPGEYFSRSKILGTKAKIDRHYENLGYAFSKTEIVPDINEADQSILVKFVVEPGKQIYVHRIQFSGNFKTKETALRQQMRLMEASPYSAEKIDKSIRQFYNQAYIERVSIDKQPVPGSPREVDLDVKIKERSTGNIKGELGYTKRNLLYRLGYNDENFLGTGKLFGFGLDNSTYSQRYYLNYNNPYFTPEGISLGYSFSANFLNPSKIDLTSAYSIDKYIASMNFGIPVSEYSRLFFSIGYEHIKLRLPGITSLQVASFAFRHGRDFDNFKLELSWNYNNVDRLIFPTEGSAHGVSAEIGLPVFKKNLRYYKGQYTGIWYKPLFSDFILKTGASLGYGNGYGNFKDLPFFLNYYAGGIGSVAGYEPYTLGPRDLTVYPGGIIDRQPIGGNILTTAQIGIILPQFLSDKYRLTVFANGGNVFYNRFQGSLLRYSAGVNVEFYLPILGAVQMSLAKTLNNTPKVQQTPATSFPFPPAPLFPPQKDKSRAFEFSFGTSL